MIISKYTSIKEIVLNMYRNTGTDQEVNLEDIAYWTYEAMEGLAYPAVYIPRTVGYKERPDYDFTEYRVQLPNDFHRLQAISVNGKIAIPKSNSLHYLLDGKCCGLDKQTSSYFDLFNDNFGNTFSPQAPPLTMPTQNGVEPITFDINNTYVTFNTKEGRVCMAYWAFPIDEEGFPLVPDAVPIKEAVTQYIQERLDYRGYRLGKIPREIYQDSKKERNWAMAKGYSALRTPDEHQMESIKNMLFKMAVRKDDYLSGFRNAVKPAYQGRY